MKIPSIKLSYWAESKNESILVTLTESNMEVFSCSEVTLCRIRARCRAMCPSSSSTFRSAPLLTRSSTMDVWPWDIARRSGVCLFLISLLAWPYIKNEDNNIHVHRSSYNLKINMQNWCSMAKYKPLSAEQLCLSNHMDIQHITF